MHRKVNPGIEHIHNYLSRYLSPSLVDIIEFTDLPIKASCERLGISYYKVRQLLEKYKITPSQYRTKAREKNGLTKVSLKPKGSSTRRLCYGMCLDRYSSIGRTPGKGNSYLRD